jgi:asparagine synthase (glutamine-hydrolysing)
MRGDLPGPRDALSSLDPPFETALGSWTHPSRPLTLLFSGGVDSGLLAWELRGCKGLSLLCIGLPGAGDLSAASSGAREIGLPLRIVELDSGEVLGAAERWRPFTQDLPRARALPLIGLALGIARSAPGPVMCGQGADELFLGYAHFAGLSADSAAQRSTADLGTLTGVDAPRAGRIAQELGHELCAPYLDPGFVEAARSIPIRERLPTPVPKALFRAWARHRGVPRSIAERPKKALQFGTGIARLLARANRVGRNPGM